MNYKISLLFVFAVRIYIDKSFCRREKKPQIKEQKKNSVESGLFVQRVLGWVSLSPSLKVTGGEEGREVQK